MGEEPKASRTAPGNDNRDKPANPPRPDGLAADFVMAVRFYSLLPMGLAAHERPDINRIARAAPFASLVIAALPALLLLGGWVLHMPTLFTAIAATGLGAAITGAMAEDAIGDSMDGLGGRSPERRLEILKDSRIGAYGVIGITIFIGLKAAALSQLLTTKAAGAVLLFLAAQVIARSGSLALSHYLPPARKDGASATVGALRRGPMLVGFGFAGLIALLLAAPFVGIVGVGLALLFAFLTIICWIELWKRLIGGQTGDLIGGLAALLEIAALTAFILFAGSPR